MTASPLRTPQECRERGEQLAEEKPQLRDVLMSLALRWRVMVAEAEARAPRTEVESAQLSPSSN